MEKTDAEVRKEDIKVAIMQSDIGYIKKSVDSITRNLENLDTRYVTRIEFSPIKNIVWGAVTLILIGLLGAIVYSSTGGHVIIR